MSYLYGNLYKAIDNQHKFMSIIAGPQTFTMFLKEGDKINFYLKLSPLKGDIKLFIINNYKFHIIICYYVNMILMSNISYLVNFKSILIEQIQVCFQLCIIYILYNGYIYTLIWALRLYICSLFDSVE